MPSATVNGVTLYYETHGEGPAVVFLHGSGGNHAIWWQQVGYFSRRYTAITVDLRGFGKSDDIEGGPDCLDFPADVIGLLDCLEIDKAAVVGQSLGATACLRLAVAYRERIAAVVLAASAGGIDDARLAALVAADRNRADALRPVDRLLSKEFQRQRPDLAFLFQQVGTFNTAAHGLVRNVAVKGPAPAEIAASKVPVQFLAGEEDAVLSPATMRYAHGLVPGSTLTLVPAGPHSLYWENPPVFNCLVDRFLVVHMLG